MDTGKWILKEVSESDVHYRLYMDDTEKTEHQACIYRTTDHEGTMEKAEHLAKVLGIKVIPYEPDFIEPIPDVKFKKPQL